MSADEKLDAFMNEPKQRATEVIVNHRIGYWGAPDGMTSEEVSEADAFLEAHIQWRIEQERRAQFEAGVAAAREAVLGTVTTFGQEVLIDDVVDVIDALHEGGQ